jgi:methionyl-tRNA synthetase
MLFARLDAKVILEKVNKKMEENKKEQIKEEVKEQKEVIKKPEIAFDDFTKVQLQIALITACEKVEKSKKLLKLTVKLGEETRTVVSGIANAYSPEYLIGKKVLMVTNLKPAKLCGIMSEGMIVCAEDENGNLAFMTPEKDMPDGSNVY